MKLSEIQLNLIKSYLRIDEDFKDDDELIMLYLESAKDYMQAYVGSEVDLDSYKDATMAALVLVSEFYENRMATVLFAPSHINEMLDRLLFIHSHNLI